MRSAPLSAAGVASVAGSLWLAWEYWWRGSVDALAVLPGVALPIVGAGVLIGLAARPRMSMRGELAVAAEVIASGWLGAFGPPAVMLLVYLMVLVGSVVVAFGAWVAWTVVFLLAVVLFALMWLAVIGVVVGLVAAFQSDEKGNALALLLLSILVGGGGLSGQSSVFHLSEEAVIEGGIIRLAFHWTGWIPAWTFALDWTHQQLAALDHGWMISLLASIAAGILGATGAAMAARLGRQRLMRDTRLRPYLPLAAAPVADAQDLLAPATRFSVLALLMVASAALTVASALRR